MRAVNFTMIDDFNTVSAVSLQKTPHETFAVTGAKIVPDVVNSDGETHTVAYLATDVGLLSTISETAIRSIEMLCDYAENDKDFAQALAGGIQFAIDKRKSGAGREFLTLRMV